MTVSADLITTTCPPDFSLDRVVLTLSLLGHARPPIRSPRTPVSQSLRVDSQSLEQQRTFPPFPSNTTDSSLGMSTSNRRSRRSGPSCSRTVSSPKTGRPPSRASATIGTTTPLCSGSSELESLTSQHQRPCGRRTRSGERSLARTRLPRESASGLVGDRADNVLLHLSPHLNPLSLPSHQLVPRRHGFDYPEQREVDKYYPQFYHRTDREGRPIYIEQLGKLDMKKLQALTTQERQLKHLVAEYEEFLSSRLPACSAESGHLVETSCTILDLKNAGISTFYKGESVVPRPPCSAYDTVSLVKDHVAAASSIGQNNYPETMGHMFIVNVSHPAIQYCKFYKLTIAHRPHTSSLRCGRSSSHGWTRPRSERFTYSDRDTRPSSLSTLTLRTSPPTWAAAATVPEDVR